MNSNIVVMTEAGKPVFFRYGLEGDIVRQCGLVQAVRTSINGKASSFGLGEIQSISSKKLCIVFMTVGSITLMHVSDRCSNVTETEVFAKLQLEHVYAQLTFMLTTNIQSTLQYNPGFDLRSLISSNENQLRGILDESSSEGNCGPFLVSSVQSCFPISYRIRQTASRALQGIAEKLENNVAFALLVVGNKLLAVVQPSFRPHQLRVSDLHLILNFIDKQPGLTSSELWVPMCLPRFNSTGFMYAYTSCFDVQSALTLILLSSHNTTEQFQILRAASQKLREHLNLPQMSDSVLVAKDESGSVSSSTSTSDVGWKRITSESFDNGSTTDEGFVNISADMLGSESSTPDKGELLHQVRRSVKVFSLDFICQQYLRDEDSNVLLHFLFRFDVPVDNPYAKHKKHQQQAGYLSQCICPSGRVPLDENLSRQGLWSKYQKLSLRLRLGSATVEASMDAFDMIKNDSCMDEIEKTNSGHFSGIGKHCPAIGLHESPPYSPDGLSYIVEGNEIYLAMNGKHFELYMVTPSSIPVKRAATIGTKLVREMIRDEKVLFLSKPLTW